VGVPLNRPVELLNVAHAGLFAMANVSTSPLASLAVGVKLYAVPACTDVAGDPPITGAVGGVPFTTVMENAGSQAVLLPSLTRMTIFDVVPVAVGVPTNLPVYLEKLAQLGLLLILNVSLSPSASAALGVNE
jgi:hypothetical protein